MRPQGEPQQHLPLVQSTRSNEWHGASTVGQIVGAVCGAWLRVLAAPRVVTFVRETATASWEWIGVNLGLIGLVWTLSHAVRDGMEGALRSGVYHAALALLASGAIYVVARTIGRGAGTFRTQTHLYLLYHAPLSCALAILTLGPGLGNLVTVVAAPILTLYGVVLSYFMLQAAHAMDRRHALLTLLTLFLVALAVALLVILSIILVAAALAALVSHLLGG